jgi:tRNA threonylcarbamoyladenosine biosynthesis protein TsaB
VKILAIDTSSSRGSVALLRDDDLAAELRLASGETHSAHLLASIAWLLGLLGWRLEDVDLVAAGIGPGSFTGIRIGVATALGLAQSTGVPFCGVACLDALAYAGRPLESRLGALIDAQRGQFYYAEYESDGARIRAAGKPALWEPSDLEQHLRAGRLYVVGDASLEFLERLKSRSSSWPRIFQTDMFLAANIGRIATRRKRSWRSGESLKAEPLYIRPPDAMRRKLRTKA